MSAESAGLTAKVLQGSGMLSHEYDTMRSVEDGYWWYQVLRAMTCREIARCADGREAPRILDAGCGTGGTMDAMRQYDSTWILEGFDFSALAVEHTKQRGFAQAKEGSVEAIPCGNASQDVVVSLDVLYCGDLDQDRAMEEMHRVLRNGGTLIMNLPAFDCLRGRHDFAVNGVRRYTPERVRVLHQRHGFEVEKVFCWNAWLFLPVLLWRQVSKRLPSAESNEATSDLVMPPGWINSLVARAAFVDAALCRRLRSRVGTSVFSVAKAV